MGIFFHFDDDDDQPIGKPTFNYPITKPNYSEDGLGVGDIICSDLTPDFKPINEFYITCITEDKRIFSHPISRGTNTTEEEWMWSNRIKICSAIGEFDKDTMGV